MNIKLHHMLDADVGQVAVITPRNNLPFIWTAMSAGHCNLGRMKSVFKYMIPFNKISHIPTSMPFHTRKMSFAHLKVRLSVHKPCVYSKGNGLPSQSGWQTAHCAEVSSGGWNLCPHSLSVWALASLRHSHLGFSFLEPDYINSMSLGAIWIFSKAAGLPWVVIGAQRAGDLKA
jgi:hypothetical protein